MPRTDCSWSFAGSLPEFGWKVIEKSSQTIFYKSLLEKHKITQNKVSSYKISDKNLKLQETIRERS